MSYTSFPGPLAWPTPQNLGSMAKRAAGPLRSTLLQVPSTEHLLGRVSS